MQCIETTPTKIFLALLHARNTQKILTTFTSPKTNVKTSSIHDTNERLTPYVQINVYKTLLKKRQQNKTHYDKSAKNLPELHQGDTVRLKTSKDYDKIGRIEGTSSYPGSYNVISKGVRYRRNRRQLLKLSETYNNNNNDVLYQYNTPVTN